VVCGGMANQKRRQASESRARRKAIDADAAPAEAARGFCRRCSAVHRLERTPRAEAEAFALMRRIREAGRLDFDSDQAPDPRFAIERMYKEGGGKMLGILIAVPAGAAGAGAGDAEVVVLKAFSGQMYGEWMVPGWSPPTCGLTHTHPHYVKEHAKIRALVDAAGAEAAVAEALGAEVRREEDAWDGRINTLAARLREERNARRARRKRAEAEVCVSKSVVSVSGGGGGASAEGDEGEGEGAAAVSGGERESSDRDELAALEEQLAEESRKGKRELARLGEGRAAAVAEPSAALAAARDDMNRLRTQHRAMSHVLLGEIFESYRLPNFRGGEGGEGETSAAAGGESSDDDGDDFSGGLTGATLREAFVSEDEEEPSTAAAPAAEVNLPCGCGDCCAPKLLAECARRGLAPVAIAEVWMGVPTRKEGDRTEGSFYGACRGRCRPILGHMLCGADELLGERKQLIQL
jgi:hypothetical protein